MTNFLKEFDISKNSFRIVKAGALRNFNNILGFIRLFGHSGHAKSCNKSEISILLAYHQTFSDFIFLLNVQDELAIQFQNSFWKYWIPSESWSFIVICMPAHKSSSKPLLYLVFPTLPLLIKTAKKIILLTIMHVNNIYNLEISFVLDKMLIINPFCEVNFLSAWDDHIVIIFSLSFAIISFNFL